MWCFVGVAQLMMEVRGTDTDLGRQGNVDRIAS